MAKRYKKADKKKSSRLKRGRNTGFKTISAEKIKIDYIGMAGDGVGVFREKPIYVPFTMAGEEVIIDVVGLSRHGYAGVLKEIIVASADRNEALCQHFERCGGCKLQHLSAIDYANFKVDNFKKSMARRGFEEDEFLLEELWQVPLSARRRARFGVKKTQNYLVLGYRGLGQHGLFDLKTCPILDETILAILPSMRDFLMESLEVGQEIDVHITHYPEGLDIILILQKGSTASVDVLMEGAMFAETHNIARLSWQNGENGDVTPMGIRREPALSYDYLGPRGTKILMPAGGFLQASAKAETRMQNLILKIMAEKHPKGNYKIADLFCGWGSLSLPLLNEGCDEILAVDYAGEAIKSLTNGVVRAGLGHKLKSDRRDLFKDPLNAAELEAYTTVIFDPPRAGAKSQAKALAKSDIGLIIAVSCNPQSFARDARILADGGYKITKIYPLNQFLYAAHLEVLAIFEKDENGWGGSF